MTGGAAVVGIGATEFSKNSGRSELHLALEAIVAAVADAGLAVDEIDGLVTFSMDNNPEVDVARCLGLPEVRFFSRVDYGGGAGCGAVAHAAMAVLSGLASTVVCYRALNERSGRRLGATVRPVPPEPTAESIHQSWYLPFGLVTPAARLGLFARRYMHDYGATSADFGRVTVAARQNAATNPAAFFYERPITLDDHQASRVIADPLRLLDCCLESDGAVAIVVTASDRARSLQQPPVYISAMGQAMGADQESMTSFYRPSLSSLDEAGVMARHLWTSSGLRPDDVQVAILYDHFTPLVLMQIEEYGFCPRGEAKEFVREGRHHLDGPLPVNPHGGQLGEAYIHGMNGIAEGVRQVRGQAVNQVAGVEHVLVTSGPGVPTSAMILGGQP